MDEQGLSQMGGMMGDQGMMGGNAEITLKQVIEALAKGATPEDLLKMGVPQQLIEQAMAEITNGTQTPDANAGLANMYTNQMKG